jgi:hypothetical protein
MNLNKFDIIIMFCNKFLILFLMAHSPTLESKQDNAMQNPILADIPSYISK